MQDILLVITCVIFTIIGLYLLSTLPSKWLNDFKNGCEDYIDRQNDEYDQRHKKS